MLNEHTKGAANKKPKRLTLKIKNVYILGTHTHTHTHTHTQYATEDQWRNNSRKNEEMEPKQKQHPVLDVTGDGSKVRLWNVRSMNQGKLEVVKQEMVRVNVDILAISELKWTGMGEFNSDDHYIYYCGQESLRRNGIAIIVNKRL